MREIVTRPWTTVLAGKRAPILTAAAVLSAFAALASTFLFTHPALSPELMGPFASTHGLLASGLLAGLVYVGMSIALWPVAQLMAGIELAAKLFAIAGLAAVLPFAQPAEKGSGASSASGKQAVRAGHEIQIGAYGGYNYTPPSTVFMEQPGDTNLTFTDMKWMGESFKTEPYWGVRGTWWNPKLRGLGFMFDYTHAKATALKDQVVKQAGKRDGQAVPPEEPFNKTFRKLEFTHGLNFFTLNALYRSRHFHARIAPYIGIGIGLSVPHVDTVRAGAPQETRTYEHQITGFAYQALGGIEWRLLASGRASAFTEYKLTFTSNHGRLNGGGSLDTDLWTHQVPVGFSYHHWLGAR